MLFVKKEQLPFSNNIVGYATLCLSLKKLLLLLVAAIINLAGQSKNSKQPSLFHLYLARAIKL